MSCPPCPCNCFGSGACRLLMKHQKSATEGTCPQGIQLVKHSVIWQCWRRSSTVVGSPTISPRATQRLILDIEEPGARQNTRRGLLTTKTRNSPIPWEVAKVSNTCKHLGTLTSAKVSKWHLRSQLGSGRHSNRSGSVARTSSL